MCLFRTYIRGFWPKQAFVPMAACLVYPDKHPGILAQMADTRTAPDVQMRGQLALTSFRLYLPPFLCVSCKNSAVMCGMWGPKFVRSCSAKQSGLNTTLFRLLHFVRSSAIYNVNVILYFSIGPASMPFSGVTICTYHQRSQIIEYTAVKLSRMLAIMLWLSTPDRPRDDSCEM